MTATLIADALLSVTAEIALAHAHDHARDTEGQAQLTLNRGQKWAGDVNLRQGMTRIRDALAAQLPAIRDEREAPFQPRLGRHRRGLAAVAAIILHFLHIADQYIILPILLALMALLFINFMRHERNNEHTAVQVE